MEFMAGYTTRKALWSDFGARETLMFQSVEISEAEVKLLFLFNI